MSNMESCDVVESSDFNVAAKLLEVGVPLRSRRRHLCGQSKAGVGVLCIALRTHILHIGDIA